MLFMWMNANPGRWIYMGEITSITEESIHTTALDFNEMIWPRNFRQQLIVGPLNKLICSS